MKRQKRKSENRKTMKRTAATISPAEIFTGNEPIISYSSVTFWLFDS
jgi:hypothetical protein